MLKLPVVFEHFAEHKKEDKNITFLQFLAIHYLHGSPKDADYDRDMQLPFKTSCDIAASFISAYMPGAVQVSVMQPTVIVQGTKNVIQDEFLVSTYLANIWQPPKFC